MSEPTLWEWMDVTKEALAAGKRSIGEWKTVLRIFCDEHDMKPPRVIRGYDMTKQLLEADRDGLLQKAYEDSKR